MHNYTANRPIETRPAFVEAHPHLRDAHLNAQRAMFGSARQAGLPTTDAHRDQMIEGINAALGYRGSRRLVSRRQMNVDEMHCIAVALDAGLFGPDWTWSEEFTITVRPVQLSVVHFEPRVATRTAFKTPIGLEGLA